MTLHIVDVSRHQVERPDPLDLEDAKNVGITVANIQLDRGRQDDVLPPWARTYADRARELGMGASSYRWLDARISGAESAARAFDRIRQVGLDDAPHTVDCESDATETHLRAYVHTMTDLLGRPIAIYSGRWYLQPRGWKINDLSPYLWAAPSVGYLDAYPGDDSPHWTVAYGGHTTLSAMQYAVQPLPGTGLCSLSAIRDPAVWAALTGVPVAWFLNKALSNFRAAVNAKYPKRDKASDGTIGDAAHAASVSDHNPDPDGSVDAWDMDTDLNGVGKPATADIELLKSVFQAHPSSRYWIHNRQIARRANGWKREVYTGDSPHLEHVHWNTDQAHETSTAPWVLATPQGDDMYEQYDRDRLSATYGLAVELKTAVAELASEVEALKERPSVEFSAEDRAALAAAVKAAMAGGEQLAAVVASAIDSRIPAIVDAVNDDAAERAKE